MKDAVTATTNTTNNLQKQVQGREQRLQVQPCSALGTAGQMLLSAGRLQGARGAGGAHSPSPASTTTSGSPVSIRSLRPDPWNSEPWVKVIVQMND